MWLFLSVCNLTLSQVFRFKNSFSAFSVLVVQVLIIGGGIANFTDVAATFTGIITALKQYAEELRDGNISIWVRRAGPNYQEVCEAARDTLSKWLLVCYIDKCGPRYPTSFFITPF